MALPTCLSRGMMRLLSLVGMLLALTVEPIPALGKASLYLPGQGLVLHQVEGTPLKDPPRYRIRVVFSVFDATGRPVTVLAPERLDIILDGRRVEVEALEAAVEIPLELLVLFDTSGSMRGWKTRQARQALTMFLQQLPNRAHVTLWAFDEDIRTLTDFRSPREVLGLLDRLQARDGLGTCLYDALMQGVQRLQTREEGTRRVLFLLTDGVDELPDGRPCSISHLDDVLARASSVPQVSIVVMTLGNRVDRAGMQRLVQSTGGMAFHVGQEGDGLQRLQDLLDVLRAQWRAQFVAVTSAGAHTLLLRYRDPMGDLEARQEFVLPPLPYTLKIRNVDTSEPVTFPLTLEVDVLRGSGMPKITRVQLVYENRVVAQDDAPPYRLRWNPRSRPTEQVRVTLRALDAAGRVQAETTLTLWPAEPGTRQGAPFRLFPWVLGGLALVVTLVMVVVVRWRYSAGPEDGGELTVDVGDTGAALEMPDGLMPVAQLEVLYSDDPAYIGRVFILTQPRTTLGRHEDNDISFPGDRAVSRYHAEIASENGVFYLQEHYRFDRGRRVGPKYGTFVNGERLQGRMFLSDGDIIQLGPRLRLRFHWRGRTSFGDSFTLDESFDVDRTE